MSVNTASVNITLSNKAVLVQCAFVNRVPLCFFFSELNSFPNNQKNIATPDFFHQENIQLENKYVSRVIIITRNKSRLSSKYWLTLQEVLMKPDLLGHDSFEINRFYIFVIFFNQLNHNHEKQIPKRATNHLQYEATKYVPKKLQQSVFQKSSSYSSSLHPNEVICIPLAINVFDSLPKFTDLADFNLMLPL